MPAVDAADAERLAGRRSRHEVDLPSVRLEIDGGHVRSKHVVPSVGVERIDAALVAFDEEQVLEPRPLQPEAHAPATTAQLDARRPHFFSFPAGNFALTPPARCPGHAIGTLLVSGLAYHIGCVP